MALLCLFYFAVVATWFAAVGHLVERSLPAGAQRRWVWCGTLVSSVALPMLLSAHHSSAVIGLWGFELLRMPAAAAVHDPAQHSTLGNWIDCRSPYGAINLRVWLAGTVVLLAWGAASAWRVRRLVRGARGGDTESRAVVDGVAVTVTDVLGPATAGLLRPRVLLPRWVLSLPPDRRRYVVRHEEEHRRAHDPLLLGLASVLVALMPWNPALWWQLRRLCLAIEVDCDRRVVTALGDTSAYGELLLSVAEAAMRGPRLQPALLGRAGMLERRLVALVSPARPRLERLIAPVVATALVAIVLSVPHPALAREPVARQGSSAAIHHATARP